MNEEVEAFARSARLTENERVTLINLLSKHANQSISTHMEQVVLPVRQEVHIVAADKTNEEGSRKRKAPIFELKDERSLYTKAKSSRSQIECLLDIEEKVSESDFVPADSLRRFMTDVKPILQCFRNHFESIDAFFCS